MIVDDDIERGGKARGDMRDDHTQSRLQAVSLPVAGDMVVHAVEQDCK